MGYRTFFTMKIIGKIPDDFPIVFENTTDYNFEDIGNDSIKWYSWEEDMLQISSTYPNNVFILYGAGEDSEDKWHAVFCNGKHQYEQAILTYPPINIQSIDNIGTRCPELFI